MAIGGYFELELREGEEYHPEAIRLNSGSHAFEYILKSRKFSKIYLPYYTCEALISPAEKMGVTIEFYSINQDLEPVGDLPETGDDCAFVYINYFGLKDTFIASLSKNVDKLIIDNAQAFFSKPLDAIDTFYSPRKFFGVPDGAYLYTIARIKKKLEQDVSYKRMQHLVERIDEEPEFGYQAFQKNELDLYDCPMRSMSKLTQRLLCSIDYDVVRQKRIDNYLALDAKLGDMNEMRFALSGNSVPMVYPFKIPKSGLREFLISNKIFVAQYWLNVLNSLDKDYPEYKLVCEVIPLPVDQRYDQRDMGEIIRRIREFITN